MRRLLARLAAVALAATAAAAVPTAPAQAAACSTTTGVTVVVDYGSLGGGIGQSCVAGAGGDRASAIFPAAGYPLTYVQGQGFVCRVAGAPADDPCQDIPPAGRYWALFWSDGSGSWTYSSRGVTTLKLPDGGSVAFVWDDVDGTRTPGVAPATPTPSADPTPTVSATAKPTKQPTAKPTKSPTRAPSTAQEEPTGAPTTAPPGGPATSAPPTGTPTAAEVSPSPKRSRSGEPTPTTSPGSSPGSAAASATAAPADEPVISPAAQQTSEDDGLPAWLALVALALVGTAAGAVVLRRRRAGDGP